MSPSQKRLARAAVALGIAALVWWSIRPVLVWARERTPLEITCADYLTSRPSARWLRLTQCEPDISAGHMVIEKALSGGSSKATNVYIVLRPAGNKQASNLMVQRDDAAMLALASEADTTRLSDPIPTPRLGLDPAPDDQAGSKPDPAMLKVVAELQGPQEGMITAPDSKTRDEVVGFNIGIDDQFAILERGKKPDATFGILGLLAAVVAAALLARDIFRRPSARNP